MSFSEARRVSHSTRVAAIFVLACALVANSASLAAPSKCPEHYANGNLPVITFAPLQSNTVELWSAGYGVVYSGIARAPIWSAEHLTPGRIRAAEAVGRSDQFEADMRLPEDWRSELADFKGSGYDRGHLAPSADMPSPAADAQSFLLSNIVAQDSQNNRNLWAAIEKAVRALARHREIFVVTGPLWIGKEVIWLNGRVMVPTHLYKLIYDPQNQAAAAYLVENAPDKAHRAISLDELEALAGIRFFPGQEMQRLKLPRPRY